MKSIDCKNLDRHNWQDTLVESLTDGLKAEGVVKVLNSMELEPNFRQFCDLYTSKYSSEAARRSKVDDSVFNVDAGLGAIALHSESSFTTVQPLIINFMCLKAGSEAEIEATTYCDGYALWQRLSRKTKQYFLEDPIKYEVCIDVPRKENGRVMPWPILEFGCSEGEIDQANGTLKFTCAKYAVTKSLGGEMAFCNHLLVREQEPQVLGVTKAGKSIPVEIMDEVNDVSDDLTLDHVWRDGEMLVLDNRRYMHGRRALQKNSGRSIAIAQSLEIKI